MKPGFQASLSATIDRFVSISEDITSTTYVASPPFSVGTCVQGSLTARAILGAGVTSIEFKLQQAYSDNPSDRWSDFPLVDVANKVTVNNEYICVVKPYVLRIDANTGTYDLGPIPFPLLKPFCRLAYKITGAGTGNLDVTLALTNL